MGVWLFTPHLILQNRTVFIFWNMISLNIIISIDDADGGVKKRISNRINSRVHVVFLILLSFLFRWEKSRLKNHFIIGSQLLRRKNDVILVRVRDFSGPFLWQYIKMKGGKPLDFFTHATLKSWLLLSKIETLGRIRFRTHGT